MKKLLIAVIFLLVVTQGHCEEIKNGIYKEYYDNGNVRKVSQYKNGKLDGEYKLYFENGKAAMISYYRNGNLYGKQKTFAQEGHLIAESDYGKGGALPKVSRTYFPSGRLKSETFYKTSESGTPIVEGTMYDEQGRQILDMKDGASTMYEYVNGKLRRTIEKKDGIINQNNILNDDEDRIVEVLRGISTACEMYATEHNGNYPASVEEYNEMVSIKSSELACDSEVYNYAVSCQMEEGSYVVIANPFSKEDTGQSYKITTGGVLTSSEEPIEITEAEMPQTKRMRNQKIPRNFLEEDGVYTETDGEGIKKREIEVLNGDTVRSSIYNAQGKLFKEIGYIDGDKTKAYDREFYPSGQIKSEIISLKRGVKITREYDTDGNLLKDETSSPEPLTIEVKPSKKVKAKTAKDFWALNRKGQALRNSGEYEEAIAQYKMMIILNPGHPLAYNMIDSIYRELSKQRALTDAEQSDKKNNLELKNKIAK